MLAIFNNNNLMVVYSRKNTKIFFNGVSAIRLCFLLCSDNVPTRGTLNLFVIAGKILEDILFSVLDNNFLYEQIEEDGDVIIALFDFM